MIDLSRLRTSLTKHGAHKLAKLLELYPAPEIHKHLWGHVDGVNIESVQAHKNLSVDRAGNVPEVWSKAKAAGSETIGALVLLAIIFSHYDLMEALRHARTSPFRGTIERDVQIDGKAFTNTAHIFESLGYSVSHTKTQVSYNLSRLFEIPGLHKLTVELLGLKFKTAGWNGKTNLIDEVIDRGLNEVLSITPDQFRNWLTTGDIDALGDTLEDQSYFLDADGDAGPAAPFNFTPGHNPKKTGKVAVTAPAAGTMAQLLHNELQNTLYRTLCEKYGKDCVRTELPTGHGTSIDVVVKTAKFCWFYEIKVAKTVKACIRQAIPQLLEYAYWRDDTDVADRLYIASKFKLTKDATAFLELLRTRFNLPLHYEQIKMQ
jgi:hypothetical protein